MISLYSLWNAHIRVVKQVITPPNLEQPCVLRNSQILTLVTFGVAEQRKLVDIVKEQDVDFVVITGDMFDGRVQLSQDVIEPFKELTMPIFFVEGNHDGYSGSQDPKSLLSRNGIHVLANELVVYKGLQIVGLDYLTPDRETADRFHAPPSGNTIKDVLPQLGIDKSVLHCCCITTP